MDIINIRYMSESAYLIIAVTSLATAVVTLWVKNDRLHKRYSEQSNENFLKSLEVRSEEAKAIMRSDSTNVECYNETTRSALTQTSSAIPNEDQFLMRDTSNYSNPCIGLYLITGYLTQTEVQAIRTAYLTYRTAIGL